MARFTENAIYISGSSIQMRPVDFVFSLSFIALSGLLKYVIFLSIPFSCNISVQHFAPILTIFFAPASETTSKLTLFLLSVGLGVVISFSSSVFKFAFAFMGKAGIAFKSLQENIDTSSPTGKLVFHLLGALSEFERNLIVERTKTGLVSARQGA